MRIEIFGNPIAQQRAKICSTGKFPRMYSTQSQKLKQMRFWVEQDLKKREIDLEPYFRLPIIASVSFAMPLPQSLSNAQKNAKLWHPAHAIKSDIDNLCKWLFDLCKGIAYADDAQICQMHVKKVYSLCPCTIIDLETINEVKMSEAHEKVFKTFSPEDIQALLLDAQGIGAGYPNFCIRNPELLQEQMAVASDLLINFANKWSDKLRKIKGNV